MHIYYGGPGDLVWQSTTCYNKIDTE
jgi:hypothetical protein